MENTRTKKEKGFVALMSAIIMSAILLLLATTLSYSGFHSRFNILESELKEQSSALSESCLDIALLGFMQNPAYAGNATTSVGQNACFVGPVTTSGSTKIFKTRGIYSNSYTIFKTVVDASTFAVISIEEIPTF